MNLLLSLGWQWKPDDRPQFKDIHTRLNTMFSSSSVDDGKEFVRLIPIIHVELSLRDNRANYLLVFP